MKIKTPKFLFDKFDKYANIEYELGWILGYSYRRIFNNDFYKSIRFDTKFAQYNVSDKIREKIRMYCKTMQANDIENMINVLYMRLYEVGGTN